MLFVLLFALTISNLKISYAQTVVEDLQSSSTVAGTAGSRLFNEKIKTISSNKRIIILTNDNQKMISGDFVTLIQNEKPIIRGLVVKTRDDRTGIKVVKIYSEGYWSNLKMEQDIAILRGDDSYYWKQVEDEKKALTTKSNSSTNDPISADLNLLINDSDLKDNSADYNSRYIKSNNMIHFTIGSLKSVGIASDNSNYLHYRFAWSYQLIANWWTELGFGYSVLKKFPANDIDTSLNVFSIRLGRVFEMPFYSFLMPYLGWQKGFAKSPGAGSLLCTSSCDPTQIRNDQERASLELGLLGEIQKQSVLFGLTYFKRLVPGWTLRFDVDNTFLGAGLIMEF